MPTDRQPKPTPPSVDAVIEQMQVMVRGKLRLINKHAIAEADGLAAAIRTAHKRALDAQASGHQEAAEDLARQVADMETRDAKLGALVIRLRAQLAIARDALYGVRGLAEQPTQRLDISKICTVALKRTEEPKDEEEGQDKA